MGFSRYFKSVPLVSQMGGHISKYCITTANDASNPKHTYLQTGSAAKFRVHLEQEDSQREPSPTYVTIVRRKAIRVAVTHVRVVCPRGITIRIIVPEVGNRGIVDVQCAAHLTPPLVGGALRCCWEHTCRAQMSQNAANVVGGVEKRTWEWRQDGAFGRRQCLASCPAAATPPPVPNDW